MFGSLLWAMADIWPQEPISFSGDLFLKPLVNLFLGVGIAFALGLVLARFIPRGLFWDRLVVGATVSGTAQSSGSDPSALFSLDSLVGRTGVAATALRPSGQVEVDGRRYEAKVDVGVIDPGRPIIVRGRSDFSLIVEEIA
jgi:membrane-bound serine protease (ClpP class)